MISKIIYIAISQFSSIVPVLAGLFSYKRLTLSFGVFFYFLIFAMFMEFFAVWYARNIHNNNLPPLHLYTLVESGCFGFLFCKELFEARWKRIFAIFFIVELILGYLNAFVIGSIYEMNIVARTFEFVVLTIFCLIFFRQSLSNEKATVPIFHQPMFWLSAGGLIYFSVNALFFLLYNRLVESGVEWLRTGKILHACANILANLLFAQAFLCYRKTT